MLFTFLKLFQESHSKQYFLQWHFLSCVYITRLCYTVDTDNIFSEFNWLFTILFHFGSLMPKMIHFGEKYKSLCEIEFTIHLILYKVDSFPSYKKK